MVINKLQMALAMVTPVVAERNIVAAVAITSLRAKTNIVTEAVIIRAQRVAIRAAAAASKFNKTFIAFLTIFNTLFLFFSKGIGIHPVAVVVTKRNRAAAAVLISLHLRRHRLVTNIVIRINIRQAVLTATRIKIGATRIKNAVTRIKNVATRIKNAAIKTRTVTKIAKVNVTRISPGIKIVVKITKAG